VRFEEIEEAFSFSKGNRGDLDPDPPLEVMGKIVTPHGRQL
jgi:hypothetical protein